MSEGQGTEGTEDLRRRMKDVVAQATMSPAVRKRKLIMWVVRQALLCALAWYFWDRAWMRWVFWTGVVIAIINLAMILLMPRFLAGQRRRGNAAIDRIDALGKDDQG